MIADVLASIARLLCGCRARWSAQVDLEQPQVFYANHSSHFDALVIWSAFPRRMRRRCRVVAAADYWQATRVRRWLAENVFRAILIERRNPKRADNPVEKICAALDQGDSVIIFPEGSRGEGGNLQAFRAGLWHIVRRRPQQGFVPVWLENLSRVLPKGEVLPVPILCGLTVGRVLLRHQQSRDAFLDMLRSELAALSEASS